MHDIIHCPGCHNPLRLPQTASNRQVRCPGCGHVFLPAPEVPVLEPIDTPAPEEPLGEPSLVDGAFSTNLPAPAPSMQAEPSAAVLRRRVAGGRRRARLVRPWFLFVLAGLPLGLALLGLAAYLAADVDAGLALGLGCGAALAVTVLCLAAALTPGSVASRAAVEGILNGVAYLAGFVLLALALSNRNSEEGERQEPRRPAPVTAVGIPAAGVAEGDWREVRLPGGDCTILMPGMPGEMPVGGVMGPDILGSRKCLLHSPGRDLAFTVAYLDIADWGMRLSSLEQRSELEAQTISTALRGKVVWRGAATLAGIPAREFHVAVPGQPGTLIERLCAVKRPGCSRIYLVAVGGTSISPGCRTAEKFFGSFRVDAPPPAGRRPAPPR